MGTRDGVEAVNLALPHVSLSTTEADGRAQKATDPANQATDPATQPADLVETGRVRDGSSCSAQIHRFRWAREVDAVLQLQMARREGPRERPVQIHRRGCSRDLGVVMHGHNGGLLRRQRPPVCQGFQWLAARPR